MKKTTILMTLVLAAPAVFAQSKTVPATPVPAATAAPVQDSDPVVISASGITVRKSEFEAALKTLPAEYQTFAQGPGKKQFADDYLRMRLLASEGTKAGLQNDPEVVNQLNLMRENLRQGGVLEALGAGCVLTGGGARLAGMLDTAESLLRVPARIGYPVPLSRMPEELAQPECAALIGMLLYSHRTGVIRAAEDQGLRAKIRTMFAGSL